jgi:hypothetical protein
VPITALAHFQPCILVVVNVDLQKAFDGNATIIAKVLNISEEDFFNFLKIKYRWPYLYSWRQPSVEFIDFSGNNYKEDKYKESNYKKDNYKGDNYKEGKFKGFSVEGLFTYKTKPSKEQELMNAIKEILQRVK